MVEVRDHRNYQFSYISVTFKNSQFSPKSLPKVHFANTQRTLHQAFSLFTTRWQMDPLFGEWTWPCPGKLSCKETSLATPRVQHHWRGHDTTTIISHLAAEIFTWQSTTIPTGSKGQCDWLSTMPDMEGESLWRGHKGWQRKQFISNNIMSQNLGLPSHCPSDSKCTCKCYLAVRETIDNQPVCWFIPATTLRQRRRNKSPCELCRLIPFWHKATASFSKKLHRGTDCFFCTVFKYQEPKQLFSSHEIIWGVGLKHECAEGTFRCHLSSCLATNETEHICRF